MSDLAVRPDAGAISRAGASVGGLFSPTMQKYYNPSSYSPSWSREYTQFFWMRMGLLLVMLGLPVGLIALSIWSLAGYAAFVAVPLAVSSAKKNYSNKWTDRQAYVWKNQLTEAWQEHAEIFYRQVWDHDCDGKKHDHDRWCDYGGRCKHKHTECSYCDKRLVEINALVRSQNGLKEKSQGDTDKIIFEASEQFRKAVAEQSKPDELMKAISDSAARLNA